MSNSDLLYKSERTDIVLPEADVQDRIFHLGSINENPNIVRRRKLRHLKHDDESIHDNTNPFVN